MKLDLKKFHSKIYGAKPKFGVIDVPKLKFLSIIGSGDPNVSKDYEMAISALFALAYSLKFYSKKVLDKDYVVAPLEGLWWADDMGDFIKRAKDKWHWKMMIAQPDWIDADIFEAVRKQAQTKKPNPKYGDVKLEEITEGLCVQILNVGSYDDEAPILAKLHDEYIPAQGLKMHGLHHEIYLSDPRKTPPSKLKTILRQPVMRV